MYIQKATWHSMKNCSVRTAGEFDACLPEPLNFPYRNQQFLYLNVATVDRTLEPLKDLQPAGVRRHEVEVGSLPLILQAKQNNERWE
jgi:hypothetical protein